MFNLYNTWYNNLFLLQIVKSSIYFPLNVMTVLRKRTSHSNLAMYIIYLGVRQGKFNPSNHSFGAIESKLE